MVESLSSRSDTNVRVAVLHPTNLFRSGYDWDEAIDRNVFKRYFKSEIGLDLRQLATYDVVACYGLLSDALVYRFSLAVLTLTSLPLYVFSEGFKPKSQLRTALRRLTLRPFNSRRVTMFAIGSGAADDFRRNGLRRNAILRYGFSVPVSVAPLHRSSSVTRFLFVGQIIPRKRLGDVLQALHLLPHTHWTLNVFGDGPLRDDLTQLARDLKIYEQVSFHGLLPYAQIQNRFADHDCLILPSQYDGWGAVVNEAMQAGLAVIVSEGVRARQIVVDYRNGFQFPTGDVGALSEKLRLVSEDPTLLREIRSNNLEDIVCYTPAVLAERIHKLTVATKTDATPPIYNTSLMRLQ